MNDIPSRTYDKDLDPVIEALKTRIAELESKQAECARKITNLKDQWTAGLPVFVSVSDFDDLLLLLEAEDL